MKPAKIAAALFGALLPFLTVGAAHAQSGKAQALCTPFINAAGNVSCVPVGMTGGTTTAPYSYNWLPVGGLANAAAPTYTEGRLSGLSFDLSGRLRVLSTVSPAGTQDVNLTQILGAAPSATNPIWVSPATASTPWIMTGSGAAGTAATGVVTVQGIASMTPVQVSQATAASLNATVVGTGTFATQSAVTAASGSFASGAFASGSFASGSHASGSFASGAFASGSVASGAYASGSLASGAMVDLVALSAPVAPATATATKSALIGCQATSAGINPTTGQQAAADCDLNNNLLVSAGGAPNIATSQASVTTGNISVASARALRRAITITNVTGTSAIYCGNTGVTTSTGTYLGATAGSSITLNTTAAVFCTVAATTQTVTAVETY